MMYFTSKFNGTKILLSELRLNFGFHCGLLLLLLFRIELPMQYLLIGGKKLGNSHVPGNVGRTSISRVCLQISPACKCRLPVSCKPDLGHWVLKAF